VHPLVLLTAATLLVVLFGIALLVLSRSQPPSEVERRAGSGVAGLKRLIDAGAWQAALPWLLITGGMLAMMVSGALLLWVVLEQRATGILMLAVALFAAYRVVREYRAA
jgi:hypothetical protein